MFRVLLGFCHYCSVFRGESMKIITSSSGSNRLLILLLVSQLTQLPAVLVWAQKSPNSKELITTEKAVPLSTTVAPQPVAKQPEFKFLSGKAFAALYPELIIKEGGKWVDVPASYTNPHLGMTSIYYSTTPNFDATKPTVLFIQGGPGASSHRYYEVMTEVSKTANINIVLVDPRGVGFSTPELFELYSTSSFYSSTNTAFDLSIVQKALGIKKWSVWGSSYGTVPATIFGSLFPEQTTSVILEGTVFQGITTSQNSVWAARVWNTYLHKALNQNGRIYFTLLQKVLTNVIFETMYKMGTKHFGDLANFFNSRPLPKVLPSANMSSAEKDQLSIWAQTELTKFQAELGAISLKYNTETPETINSSDISNKTPKVDYQIDMTWSSKQVSDSLVKEIAQDPEFISNDFDFDKMMQNQLVSQEGGTAFGQSILLYDPKHGFTSTPAQGELFSLGRFDAAQYPLIVPTYYFQGTSDPATEFPAALNHYRYTAQGYKAFFAFDRSGHSPDLNKIRLQDNLWINSVLKVAISGGIVNGAEIAKYNKTTSAPAAYMDSTNQRVSAHSGVLVSNGEETFRHSESFKKLEAQLVKLKAEEEAFLDAQQSGALAGASTNFALTVTSPPEVQANAPSAASQTPKSIQLSEGTHRINYGSCSSVF